MFTQGTGWHEGGPGAEYEADHGPHCGALNWHGDEFEMSLGLANGIKLDMRAAFVFLRSIIKKKQKRP